MKIYKFEEQLNDLMDYFVLADPFTLLDFKNEHHLPNNLMANFTTTEFGDKATKEGKIIPLSKVENYPYTVYFNLTGDNFELSKPQNDLQIRKDGYLLEVRSGIVCFFTMPYLSYFTSKKIDTLLKNRTAQIKLPKGLYSVTILGGETQQQTGKEPTFEFSILPATKETKFTADINTSFKIRSEEY